VTSANWNFLSLVIPIHYNKFSSKCNLFKLKLFQAQEIQSSKHKAIIAIFIGNLAHLHPIHSWYSSSIC